MHALPQTLYVVVRDHGDVTYRDKAGRDQTHHIGIGSNDVSQDREFSYDAFAAAAEDGDPVAVWQIETCGGAPVTIRDVTAEFERELHEVVIARDLDWIDVVRFDAPLPMAAE